MGEEEAKQAETKPEEKKNEMAEEKTEEVKPPSPVILSVDLHCVGCAKKIEKSIMKFRGVEEVVIDLAQNHVTVKGIVDPKALCMIIQKKTKRRASILSPSPTPEGEPTPPQDVTSQVTSGLTTVELNVNMHCEACAQQLKKKILKMRGVQSTETDLSSGKVTVTGTMDANQLVDYVYRRTRKQARIVPQPEPEPKPANDEKPEEGEKQSEEAAAKPEEKNEENTAAKEEQENKAVQEEKNDKEEKGSDESKEDPEPKKEGEEMNEELMKRMMYYYTPLYVIERVPPPQLFSDENPNACCIT